MSAKKTASWVGKSFTALQQDVIDRRLCAYCGACAATCPLGSVHLGEHSPELVGKCNDCGLCYLACPASFLPRSELEVMSFGRTVGGLLGYYRYIRLARARDPAVRKRAQHGGLVTALLLHLLAQGEIDGTVVVGTSAESPWKPEPRLTTTAADIIAAAGTKYSLSPNLQALADLRTHELKRIAVVGSPCHIRALRKMQWANAPRPIVTAVHLTIGLCSMPQLPYANLRYCVEHLCGTKLDQVRKVEWESDGRFHVYTDDQDISIPMGKTFPLGHPACLACEDYSNELADLSAGFVGGHGDWSTLYVRSQAGAQAVDSAIRAGVIELDDLETGGLPVRITRSPLLYLYLWAFTRGWLRGREQIKLVAQLKKHLVAEKLRQKWGIPRIPTW